MTTTDNIALEVGKKYELNYKKGRAIFLYQGQDLGRNYTFVNDRGLFKIHEKQIASVDPVEVKK